MQFGIPIPQVFLDGKVDLGVIRASLQLAEERDLHSAWTQDQVIGSVAVPLMECLSLMNFAAACTERLRLGVSVIVFPIRDPVLLAKQVASLDHLSNGRVDLGLGLGPPAVAENFYRSFGTDYSERVRRFTEGLQIMKSLWTDDHTYIQGEFQQLDGTVLAPKPLQQPHPPIIFGGQADAAIRRAARLGDGFMGAGPTSTKDFAAHVKVLRAALKDEGRDPETFPVLKRVFMYVDDDATKAKAILDHWCESRYPWLVQLNPNFAADVCVWGPPEDCIAGISEITAAGAETIVLNPIADFVAQFERLTEEVIPFTQQTGV
jgi:probable F420-dependent oxidoreductase